MKKNARSERITLYAYRDPRGVLRKETAGLSLSDAWASAFQAIVSEQGDGWRARYWKRLSESKAAARKLGWRLVTLEAREVRRG